MRTALFARLCSAERATELYRADIVAAQATQAEADTLLAIDQERRGINRPWSGRYPRR